MYSSVIRTDGYKRRLLRFIKFEYGINVAGIAGITPAKRGFYGETWRLDTPQKLRAAVAAKTANEEGLSSAEETTIEENTIDVTDTQTSVKRSYFVKLDYSPHRDIYERSFPVVEYLCNSGIDFISKVVKTTDGRLFTRFDGAVLGVFEWIDGENTQTNESKIPEFRMLARVYDTPYEGLPLSREDFSSKSVDTFYTQWNILKDEAVNALLEKNRAKIEHRAGRLRAFSDLCRGDTTNFYISHGDAGGNFIAGAQRNYIVDWDEPLLAPPERDAWVMCSYEWARDAFHEALRQNGIAYTLRPERLAYYCYHYFFFYLTSYLDALPLVGPEQLEAYIEIITEYLDSWVQDSFDFADMIRYTGA